MEFLSDARPGVIPDQAPVYDPLLVYGGMTREQLAKLHAEKVREAKRLMTGAGRWMPEYQADLNRMPFSQLDYVIGYYSPRGRQPSVTLISAETQSATPAARPPSFAPQAVSPGRTSGIERRGFLGRRRPR